MLKKTLNAREKRFLRWLDLNSCTITCHHPKQNKKKMGPNAFCTLQIGLKLSKGQAGFVHKADITGKAQIAIIHRKVLWSFWRTKPSSCFKEIDTEILKIRLLEGFF